jgi:hypothetical protein
MSTIPRELLPLPLPAEPNPDGVDTCSRQVRSRKRARHQRWQWEADVVHALNSLACPGVQFQGEAVSAGQAASLDHIRSTIDAAGAPPCGATAAFDELCGCSPGYTAEPESRVSYRKGLVSLPSEGASCDPGTLLAGEARDQWYDWENSRLCSIMLFEASGLWICVFQST